MKALLYKQLKLVAHPMSLVFVLCGAMVLIPNYPYTVSFFYVTMGIFFMFLNAREQRDNDFSSLLPIRKRDSVKAAVIFTVLIELLNIAVCTGFVFLSNVIARGRNNLAGIDANAAIIGVGFLLFAVFNASFLPSFYKSAYKVGTSFLKSSICVFIIVGLDVMMPHIVPWLDGQDVRQYAVLCIGAIAFAVATALSYKRSATLFERVDL